MDFRFYHPQMYNRHKCHNFLTTNVIPLNCNKNVYKKKAQCVILSNCEYFRGDCDCGILAPSIYIGIVIRFFIRHSVPLVFCQYNLLHKSTNTFLFCTVCFLLLTLWLFMVHLHVFTIKCMCFKENGFLVFLHIQYIFTKSPFA